MNRYSRLRRLTLSLLLLAAPLFPVRAQDMIALFSNLPDSMLPLIDAKARGALLLSSARPAIAKNALGGTARLDTLADNYLSLAPTGNSRFEMLLLPAEAEGRQVIAVIETVAAPAEDSKLSFYTTDWHPLPSERYFTAPTGKDFLTEDTDLRETEGRFRPIIIGYRYDAIAGTLIAYCRPELYIPKEQYEKLKNALRSQPIAYRWNHGRFMKE